MNSNEKTVWDLGVRIFHWSLVACFIASYLTGDENTEVHSYLGYTMVGLLAFRIIWGFVGTQHARFTDFIYSPPQIIAYCRGLVQGEVEHFEGHNPAGGLMIMVMMLCLIATTYTGLMTYGAEGHGPFAGALPPGTGSLIASAYADHDDDDDDDDDDEHGHDRQTHRAEAGGMNLSRDHESDDEDGENEAEEFWEEIHEFFVNLMLLLIIIHVAAVVVSSRLHGENLVRAMITGKKPAP